MPVSLNGERLGLVDLLERAAEIGCRHGVGIVDHIEDRIVGLKVRDIYEVPAAAIVLTAHEELERLVGTIHQNQFKPGARPEVGLPRLRRALVGAAAHRPRRLHGRGQRPGDAARSACASTKAASASSPAPRPTPSTTPSWPASPSPAASSRRPPRRASSSSGRCSRGWRTGSASAGRGRADVRQGSARPRSASPSATCAAATGARSASASASPRSSSAIGAYLASRNVPEG